MITLLIPLSLQPQACSLHERLPYSLIMFTSSTLPQWIRFSVSTKQISKAICGSTSHRLREGWDGLPFDLKGIQPLNFSSKWVLGFFLLICSSLILQLCAFCPSSPTLSLPQCSPFPFLFLSLPPFKAWCSDDMLQALSETNLLYGTTFWYLILRDLWNQEWPKGGHRGEDGQERKESREWVRFNYL